MTIILLYKLYFNRVISAAAALWLLWLASLLNLPLSLAADSSDLSSEWGGHIRAIGTLSYPDDQSIYQFADTGTFFDRQAELRLNHQLFMGSTWSLETHYELVGRQGDTIKNNNRLRTVLPSETAQQLVGRDAVSDDQRLMNLTRIINDGDDDVVYHRLDRLNLTYASDLATVRVGRQALTWGNGLLFNPMDIFNPFAPTSVQRDYKVGEDMVHLQFSKGNSDGQVLYLPRRDPETGSVSDSQSSQAGKWHFPVGAMEFDLMAARHFKDVILGGGATGSLGGAGWRWDITYAHLDDDAAQDDFWQVVVNMDYAWQWGGKNIYGLIEYYHNGLGEKGDYGRALSDPAISQRVARGELFTLGRDYLAGQLRYELHPLLLANAIAIVNLADGSAIFQPQLLWDVATNFQLIIGANFNRGDDGTEFGGFDSNTGLTSIKVSPTQSRYLWITYYF